ncbi:hypothetical protein GF352_01565 [archaeon]|nr:hypothetical protein [archaeon]
MIDVLDDFKRIKERMDQLSKAMIVDPFSDDFFDVFTRKRIELVKAIMDNEPRSIRALAQRVERDIKNVFNDLKLLHNFRIIEFKKIGRCKKPIVKKKTIIFRFKRGEQ